MKSRMIFRGLILAVGLLLSGSIMTEKLSLKIDEAIKEQISDLYDNSDMIESSISLNVGTQKLPDAEKKAWALLFPKFLEVIKKEATKSYWLWKPDYKKSGWWKALNAPGRDSGKFMAYLYNINGDEEDKEKRNQSMVEALEDGGRIYYFFRGGPRSFDDKSINQYKEEAFYSESVSFFKRHWGKLALGALAVGAAGYGAYRYAGRTHPPKDEVTEFVRLDRSEIPGSIEHVPSSAIRSSKSPVLYSSLEESDKRPSFRSRLFKGSAEREQVAQGQNPVREKFRQRINQAGEALRRYGQRADLGQQERIARTTGVGRQMLDYGTKVTEDVGALGKFGYSSGKKFMKDSIPNARYYWKERFQQYRQGPSRD